VARFLTHPLVPRSSKTEFLKKAFPDINPYLQNLFSLVVHNRREGYIDMIYDRFVALHAETEGIVQVQVMSAQPLSADDLQRLSEHLEKSLRQRVRLSESVDEKMLGNAAGKAR